MKFRVAAFTTVLTALPIATLAQVAPGGTGATGISGTGSAGCTAIVNSAAAQAGNGWLTGILVLLAGTPFKVVAGLAVVIGVIMLLSDSGHVPQIARMIISVVIAIMVVGVMVGFIFGNQVNIATC